METGRTKIGFYNEYTDSKAAESMKEAIHYYNRARILQGIIDRNELGIEERSTLEFLAKECREKAEEEHRTANRLEAWYRNPVMRAFTNGQSKVSGFLDEAYQGLLKITGQLR